MPEVVIWKMLDEQYENDIHVVHKPTSPHGNAALFPIEVRLGTANPGLETILLEDWEARELAESILAALDGKTDAVDEAAPEADAPSLNELLIQTASEFECEIAFAYAKGEGANIEPRRLLPSRIEEGRAGGKIVVGYDPDRDEPRAYRLDRIKGLVSLG